jgi:hypothetical protein
MENTMIKRLVRKLRLWNKPWNPFFSPSLHTEEMGKKLVIEFREWMLRPYASHSPSIVTFYGEQLSDEVKQRIALAEKPIDAELLEKISKRYKEIMGIEDGDNESN